MEKKEIEININDIKSDFNNFLLKENNDKIFLSGKFGIGKTYFLKNMFNEYKDDYEVFHLFPINYQIHDKSIDILEILKYDILIELLNKNNKIFSESDIDIGMWEYIKKEITMNSFLLGINNNLIKPIPNIGKFFGRSIESLLNFDKKFQKFKKGDDGKIKEFLDEIQRDKISETDYISYIINKKIFEFKKDKKSILILDDLDRLDPENIFRLLNVFSSFSEINNKNKFGFDKIIIVADYDNLKNIFHHKYGKETDFTGYIDKFYSIEPYYFDNTKAIIESIDNIIYKIKCNDDNLKNALGNDGYIKLILEYFYINSVKNNLINLRKLLKANKFLINSLEEGTYLKGFYGNNIHNSKKLFDIGIKILITIFDGRKELLDNIVKIKNLGIKYNKEYFPFEFYISIMLKVNGIEITKEGIKYKEYKIKEEDNMFSNISIVEGDKEKLFLELLIDYLKEDKINFRFEEW